VRQIGTLPGRGQADSFANVLLADHIRAELEDSEDGVILWIHDDARVADARALLARFLENPNDAAFLEADRAGRAKEADRLADEARWRSRVRHAQRSIYGADGRGWITMALLGLSVLVAAASNLGSNLEPIAALFFTTYPADAGLPELRAGQVWRLITPIFIHFGAMHLLFNGWNWWTWAGQIEVRKGAPFFAIFVLSAAVTSNLSEHLWGLLVEPDVPRLFGGLSGVLYALFGYAWTKGRIDAPDHIGVPEQTVSWMLGWAFLCLTGALGPIANAAHFSGLAFGVAWAYVDVWWFHWRKHNP
jgi:GlpG protein